MKPLRGARKSARPLTAPSTVALTRLRLIIQRSEENSIGTSGESSIGIVKRNCTRSRSGFIRGSARRRRAVNFGCRFQRG